MSEPIVSADSIRYRVTLFNGDAFTGTYDGSMTIPSAVYSFYDIVGGALDGARSVALAASDIRSAEAVPDG